MEANNNNDGAAFRRTPRKKFFEYTSSSRDDTFSNNGGQWHETRRDHYQRDHSKNRDCSGKFDWNPDRTYHGMDREIFQEENRDRFSEVISRSVQQQSTPFTNYGYDHSYVDISRQAMNMRPTSNLLASVNKNMQWGMDGMTMPPNNMPVNPSSTPMPMTTGMEIENTANSVLSPYSYMGEPGDNMSGMMSMGNYCHSGKMNSHENLILDGTIKEVIYLTLSVLYPPKPTDPVLPTRGRPEGCKSVFVGGLPEKATEEIIREIFDLCGEIITIQMNKRNFCLIRFTSEAFVERAMHFSGYRMKIENRDDQPYSGILHISYSQARDDVFNFKCQEKAIQCESRPRQQQEYFKILTPPPVVHYSLHEATILGDKLRSEETFQQAVFILITWLKRGECNKQNASIFYALIQSTNNQVRRLRNEKLKYEDEFNKARLVLKKHMQNILQQCKEIGKVLNAASLQKVWDHFTKAQRKNIELWKKQTEEVRNAHAEEVIYSLIEAEMDLGKDESAVKKTPDTSNQKNKLEEELNKLKEENDSLQYQLKGVENETVILRSEKAQALEIKDSHIQSLMKELQCTTNTLNQKHAADEAELKEFRPFKSRKIMNQDGNGHSEIDNICSVSTTSSVTNISESEARFIGLVSTFLLVHPFGANIDYICSYLHQIDSTIQPKDVENLMKRFPTIYREDSSGVGASLGKKWRLLVFHS